MKKVKVIDPFKIDKIVDSSNAEGNLTKEIEVDDSLNFVGVSSEFIPVDLEGLRQFKFTKVEAGSSVAPHSHHGPVVRLIVEGEAIMNGNTYKEGDWMVVPSGVEYSAETSAGYKGICIYLIC